MIVTVTLNAAVDKTYYVSGFAAGAVQRVRRQIAEPGGKGNNVAKIVRLLGGEAAATGFSAGGAGAFIEERLAARGIGTAFVRIAGESRTCLNIVDEASGASTELLEEGPTVGDAELAEIKEAVGRLGAQASVVVLSGSLPAGAPADLYAELVDTARSAGARVYLDASGEALALGIRAKPDLIKPNEEELARLTGRRRLEADHWTEAAAKLHGQGIRQVCATLGRQGAVACMDGKLYRVIAPSVSTVSAVGCGDAFMAGMAYADELGLPAADRLRMAAAAGAAAAMTDRAGELDPAVYERLLDSVEVLPL
ncbi:1-phosphofructokinase family hexose kinase [Cohnella ginsengisoli]|uniref:Tagatose-6-phosphate kinase n=1 Tax=Cohnella ginsengisoli TaxID=425004 RepID=A0A9X4QMX3_9BACL|nr:1-phosphofructokinase family hexose kinase [Cohnella ginsengisoli]MDG0792544.1 1-phosphofructokinase family hexose kinase [Cohnella ginsengisoli]